MRIPLVILCIFFFSATIAQNVWLRKVGGAPSEEALDVASNSSHLFSTGYFNQGVDFFGTNLQSNGGSDVFVMKTLTNGNPGWSKKFGGPLNDRGTAIATNSSGSIFVAGQFRGEATFGSFTLNANGNDSTDVFVMKLDPNGVVEWAVSCGGNGTDEANGIAVDVSGNVYVTGRFRGNAFFGTTNLTSVNYEGTSNPSMDAFVFKLNPNGNWLWTKSGSSVEDNKGMDVDVDGSGNVYWAGIFGGQLTIDNTQNLNLLNAGFLVKLNTDGDEQWFRHHTAAQLSLYEVEVVNDNTICVSGNQSGQLGVFDNGLQLFPFDYANNAYVLKYNSSGNFGWQFRLGSESYLNVQGLDSGPSDEIYISGVFNCAYDELAEIYGIGYYYSVGYRDVFVARISPQGSLDWARHMGGPNDDFISGVTVTSSNNVFTVGGFSGYIAMARGSQSSSFPENDETYDPLENLGYQYFVGSSNICGNSNYNNWLTCKSFSVSSNARDIFISCVYNASQPEFDPYFRQSCTSDLVDHCLSNNITNCVDFTEACEIEALFFVQKTHFPGMFGPGIDTTMAPGMSYSPSENAFFVSETGWYWMEVERLDGCRSYTDSIYVEITDAEPPPLILVNGEYGPENTVAVGSCGPELWDVEVLNICDGCTFEWLFDSQTGTSFQEFGEFSYQGVMTDPNGCQTNCYVSASTSEYLPLEPIPLEIELTFNGVEYFPGDTINVCSSAFINLDILTNTYDSGYYATAPWDIFMNGNQVQYNVGNWDYSYLANESGLFEFTTYPIIGFENFCDTNQVIYQPLTTSVYINVTPPPVLQIIPSVPLQICPGDSLLVSFSGADSFTFYSIQGFDMEIVSENSVLIWEPGQIGVFAASVGLDGCFASFGQLLPVTFMDTPGVSVFPGEAIICPGESVTLEVESGLSYEWIGPLSGQNPFSQTITVSEPGFYYCVQESSEGCFLESDLIEVKEYSTPGLTVYPDNISCTQEPIELQVFSISPETIVWAPPLSGSEDSQTVTESGTYTVYSEACGIVTEMSVEIAFSTLEFELSTSPSLICSGDSVMISIVGNADSYSSSTLDLINNTAWVSNPGTYAISGIDALGCEQTETVFIQESTISSPQPADVAACIGEDIELTASGSPSYLWYADSEGTELLGEGQSLTLSNIESGSTLFVAGTDGTCLTSLVPINLFLNPLSFMPEILAQDTVCKGGEITFSVDPIPGASYSWQGPGNINAIGESLTINNATILNTGWYTLTLSSNECPQVASQSYLFVEIPPIIAIDGEELLCEGEPILLTTELDNGELIWQTPQGEVSGNSIIIDESNVNDSGTYQLVVTDANCDYQFYPKNVEVVAKPSLELDDAIIYCLVDFVVIEVPDSFDFYEWSDGSSDNSVAPDSTGLWWLEVGVEPGCFSRDSLFVDEVTCEGGFFNVFSPNYDGVNENVDFGLHPGNFNEVLIYNRWGTLVRRLTTVNLLWDGRGDNGQLLSDGTYFWIGNGSVKNDSGSITLLGTSK